MIRTATFEIVPDAPAQKALRILAPVSDRLRRLIDSLTDPYRPEKHYMRGPGPKWHAKHGGRAVSA